MYCDEETTSREGERTEDKESSRNRKTFGGRRLAKKEKTGGEGEEMDGTGIKFRHFQQEADLHALKELITADLSEPYSIYTYRYFVYRWPELCILATDEEKENKIVGVIVCKMDTHKRQTNRGYIGMLAVLPSYRKKRIGSSLVQEAIRRMKAKGCEEVVLETEASNGAALSLYQRLGFIRDKRLQRYYLNGGDAFRLKLILTHVNYFY